MSQLNEIRKLAGMSITEGASDLTKYIILFVAENGEIATGRADKMVPWIKQFLNNVREKYVEKEENWESLFNQGKYDAAVKKVEAAGSHGFWVKMTKIDEVLSHE